MAKRQSSRPSSPSPASTPAVYDDDGAVERPPKPAKRLKTEDGSAAASPGSTTAHEHDVEPEAEDEEMADTPTVDKAVVKKESKERRKAGSLSRGDHDDEDVDADAEDEAADDDDADIENEAEVDDDADMADATVVHPDSDDKALPADPRDARDGQDNHHASNGNLPDNMSDISEDTDGDVPIPKKKTTGSSSHHHLAEEDINNNEPQVTVCSWDGCQAGDLGTMDKLVEHLHGEHVEGKQRRYTCEWIGCSRKGKSHASAYALKAHLRSHTREKPHVCLLPECDLAFARQDALNKHMRTAHDIDLMRSIDPAARAIPVGSTINDSINSNSINNSSSRGALGTTSVVTNGGAASNGHAATNGKAAAGSAQSNKLKIIIKTPHSHAAGLIDSFDFNGASEEDVYLYVNMAGTETTTLTKEQGFDAYELAMPTKSLYGLCWSKLRWAEEESETLRKECEAWEETYYKSWLEQQVLLDQVVQSEKDWYERRKAVLASLAAIEEKHAAEAAAKGVADDEDEDEDEDEENDNDEDEDEDAGGASRANVRRRVKEEDESGAEDDNENADGDAEEEDDEDDDVPSIALDPDATQDDMSLADATSFSVAGSSLRHEVTVNGD